MKFQQWKQLKNTKLNKFTPLSRFLTKDPTNDMTKPTTLKFAKSDVIKIEKTHKTAKMIIQKEYGSKPESPPKIPILINRMNLMSEKEFFKLKKYKRKGARLKK